MICTEYIYIWVCVYIYHYISISIQRGIQKTIVSMFTRHVISCTPTRDFSQFATEICYPPMITKQVPGGFILATFRLWVPHLSRPVAEKEPAWTMARRVLSIVMVAAAIAALLSQSMSFLAAPKEVPRSVVVPAAAIAPMLWESQCAEKGTQMFRNEASDLCNLSMGHGCAPRTIMNYLEPSWTIMNHHEATWHHETSWHHEASWKHHETSWHHEASWPTLTAKDLRCC